jgi:hypothetical protein
VLERNYKVRPKLKNVSLVSCLFLFLLVVLGGGLRLSPAGALLAAATGTPLIMHAFNRGSRQSITRESSAISNAHSSSTPGLKVHSRDAPTFESTDIMPQ